MAYPDPTTKSIWCRQGRYTPGGNSPRYIVVHNTANTATAVQEANNLHNNAGQSSFHYAVDDTDVVHCVHDYDAAWAVGAWTGTTAYITNFESISTEVCNAGTEFTEASKKNLRALVLHLMEYYDIPADRVVRHYDCHSGHKLCPMFYSQHVDKWNELHAYITTAPAPEKPPLPDALKGFTDLDSEAWYVDSIEEVVTKGVMSGYKGTTKFGPDDALSRGQAACILANVGGADIEEPYSDVTASPYYYKAVEWCKAQGYVSDEISEFRPDDPCTRAEFATMMWRLKGEPEPVGEPSGYPDWTEVPEFAKKSMAWAVESGMVSGANGKLLPNDACTRAQAAAMISNIM